MAVTQERSGWHEMRPGKAMKQTSCEENYPKCSRKEYEMCVTPSNLFQFSLYISEKS